MGIVIKHGGKQKKKMIQKLDTGIIFLMMTLFILNPVLTPITSSNEKTILSHTMPTQGITPPGQEPIIIIHGFMDCYWSPWWDVLKKNLCEIGYASDDIYVVNLGVNPFKNVNSPIFYAKKIDQMISNISQEENSKVDIIAHSMGGLDARWFIEKLDGDRFVDDLITLGTPHQGSYVAYLAYFTPGGKDLIPDSDFLKLLNDGQLAQGVEYTAVWSDSDEFIVPKESAKIPSLELNSVEKARNIFAGRYEHVQLVTSKKVLEQYMGYLD